MHHAPEWTDPPLSAAPCHNLVIARLWHGLLGTIDLTNRPGPLVR